MSGRLAGRSAVAAAIAGCALGLSGPVEACQCESITPFRTLALGAPVVLTARMESEVDMAVVFRVVEVVRGEFRDSSVRIETGLDSCHGRFKARRGEVFAFVLPREPYALDDYGLRGRKGYVYSNCTETLIRVRTGARGEGVLVEDVRRWAR